jgi:hypothetical protein
MLAHLVKILTSFMQPDGSVPCSQEPPLTPVHSLPLLSLTLELVTSVGSSIKLWASAICSLVDEYQITSGYIPEGRNIKSSRSVLILSFVSHLISVPYIFQQNLTHRSTFQFSARDRYLPLLDLIATSHM